MHCKLQSNKLFICGLQIALILSAFSVCQASDGPSTLRFINNLPNIRDLPKKYCEYICGQSRLFVATTIKTYCQIKCPNSTLANVPIGPIPTGPLPTGIDPFLTPSRPNVESIPSTMQSSGSINNGLGSNIPTNTAPNISIGTGSNISTGIRPNGPAGTGSNISTDTGPNGSTNGSGSNISSGTEPNDSSVAGSNISTGAGANNIAGTGSNNSPNTGTNGNGAGSNNSPDTRANGTGAESNTSISARSNIYTAGAGRAYPGNNTDSGSSAEDDTPRR